MADDRTQISVGWLWAADAESPVRGFSAGLAALWRLIGGGSRSWLDLESIISLRSGRMVARAREAAVKTGCP
jgi:hypothetical protein